MSGPRHHPFAPSLLLRTNLLCHEQDTWVLRPVWWIRVRTSRSVPQALHAQGQCFRGARSTRVSWLSVRLQRFAIRRAWPNDPGRGSSNVFVIACSSLSRSPIAVMTLCDGCPSAIAFTRRASSASSCNFLLRMRSSSAFELFVALPEHFLLTGHCVVDHFDAEDRVRKSFEPALLQLISTYQRRILTHRVATLMTTRTSNAWRFPFFAGVEIRSSNSELQLDGVKITEPGKQPTTKTRSSLLPESPVLYEGRLNQ
jgi:hypothetical protein